jgi:hypothetical protein
MPADPNWSQAVVPVDKLVAYLLAPDHPEGGPKAAFFLGCGFQAGDHEAFAQALREQAARATIRSVSSPHGVKYIASGAITGADGRNRMIQSIWIVERGQDVARFVTAYPREA